MECKDVRQEIPSLVYGELDAKSARALKEHLDACSACRGEWERLQETVSRLDAWPDIDAPLDPALFLERARRGSSFFARILKPLSIAAAAGLLVIVTLALIGVEVRHTEGGLVITLGRPAPSDIDYREMIQEEFEQNLEGLFETVALHLDAMSRDQEEKRVRFAQAVHFQREEDLRFTKDLVHQVALESAAELERNRLILEGLAHMVRPGKTEMPEKRY